MEEEDEGTQKEGRRNECEEEEEGEGKWDWKVYMRR